MNPAAVRLEKLCCKADGQVIPFHAIARVDARDIEHLRISIHLLDGQVVEATGIDALELCMQVKPSVLEGKRLGWAKRAWLVHNLIGHPLMQILALLGQTKCAMWVHDRTVPRPHGPKTGDQ